MKSGRAEGLARARSTATPGGTGRPPPPRREMRTQPARRWSGALSHQGAGATDGAATSAGARAAGEVGGLAGAGATRSAKSAGAEGLARARSSATPPGTGSPGPGSATARFGLGSRPTGSWIRPISGGVAACTSRYGCGKFGCSPVGRATIQLVRSGRRGSAPGGTVPAASSGVVGVNPEVGGMARTNASRSCPSCMPSSPASTRGSVDNTAKPSITPSVRYRRCRDRVPR